MCIEKHVQLNTPSDAAGPCGCSPSTVKRVACELRLPIIRTRGGVALFTDEDVQKIKTELERRARETKR